MRTAWLPIQYFSNPDAPLVPMMIIEASSRVAVVDRAGATLPLVICQRILPYFIAGWYLSQRAWSLSSARLVITSSCSSLKRSFSRRAQMSMMSLWNRLATSMASSKAM